MISESSLQAMEKIIVEHAGPLGRFVMRKTIADMGVSPESFDEELLNQFIDTVLERSIYDPAKWKMLRIEIFETCKFPGRP